MINKDFYPLFKSSLFVFLLCVSQLLVAQTQELKRILINQFPVPNVEESDWINEISTINVLNDDNQKMFTVKIIPDSGQIKVMPTQIFPIKVFVNKKLMDSQLIQLSNKIKKHKVGLKSDNDEQEYFFLEARIGNKLRLKATDLLIVPFVLKLLNQPFRLFFPKKVKIQIFKRET
ncbi:MAG: hypothetical protein ACE5HS_10630 [bacterium]